MDHRIEALVAKYRPTLLALALRMCRATGVDPEALVQETVTRFIETFGPMSVLPSERECRTWLAVTLSHRFMDRCRRRHLRDEPQKN
ncbi:MAG TPA: sigma factor [Myxococcaceae bacterium]|nr:sigma factor [Myxococcaceae bacterium]